MDTKKQRQRRRDDTRLTENRNAKSEQLNTHGAYRVTNQQSLACLSGSERRRPGWFLDKKYQTCFVCFGGRGSTSKGQVARQFDSHAVVYVSASASIVLLVCTIVVDYFTWHVLA